jgi:hypothetical protein
MGYYVTVEESKLEWKPDTNLNMVLRHIKQTMFNDNKFVEQHASGGSWSGGKKTSTHYAWINMDEAKATKTIYEMINQFVDDVDNSEDPVFYISMDSKTGQESVLFEQLAPFIKAGSFVDWRGEDGMHFRWMFDGETMKEVQGTITYDHED